MWKRQYLPLVHTPEKTIYEWQYTIDEQCPEVVEKINSFLPPDIRIVKAVPVKRYLSSVSIFNTLAEDGMLALR